MLKQNTNVKFQIKQSKLNFKRQVDFFSKFMLLNNNRYAFDLQAGMPIPMKSNFHWLRRRTSRVMNISQTQPAAAAAAVAAIQLVIRYFVFYLSAGCLAVWKSIVSVYSLLLNILNPLKII